MAGPPERKREGYFSASGVYKWIAFSDGQDEFKGSYPNLDLRRKVIHSDCLCLFF